MKAADHSHKQLLRNLARSSRAEQAHSMLWMLSSGWTTRTRTAAGWARLKISSLRLSSTFSRRTDGLTFVATALRQSYELLAGTLRCCSVMSLKAAVRQRVAAASIPPRAAVIVLSIGQVLRSAGRLSFGLRDFLLICCFSSDSKV